jgi:hypothetical protein
MDNSEVRGVDGFMGSEWILGRLGGACVVDSTGSGWGTVAGPCKHGDEPSVSGAKKLQLEFLTVSTSSTNVVHRPLRVLESFHCMMCNTAEALISA